MMKKDILAAVLLVCMLAVIAAGCRSVAASTAIKTVEQAAEQAVVAVEPVKLYYTASVALIVVGGIIVAIGGKVAGFTLIGTGFCLGWFGQTLVRHPWLSLVAVLVAALAAAAVAYDRWKARRELRRTLETTEALAEAIQNSPDGQSIKDGVAALGAEVEAKVRSVITPIKERLAKLGKI